MVGKVINEGSNVTGDVKLSDVHMVLNFDVPPINFDTFKDLPHIHWDKPAPHRNSLHQSNYFFRFRFPPENKWLLGRVANNSRTIDCWTFNGPPFISSRDEFVNGFVHEASHAWPELSGRFGTLMGSKLIECALEAVPEEVLWDWLEYKERQRLNR